MAIQLSGSLAITGSLVATSQIVAQTLNVQQVTSSIVYSSGSNIFGNSVSNTQQFTGSLQVSSSTSYILGNVGIGTTSPATKLDVIGNIRNSNAGQTVYTEIQNDGLYATGTDLYLLAPASKFMSFYTGGGERLRIASTGIACFACQVCVPNIISTGASGGRYATFNAPTNGGYITFEAGGTPFGDLGSYCAQYGTGDATTLSLQSRTGYALALGTNSTEKVRIDTTGNLMVGSVSAGNAGSINVSVGCAGTTAGGLQLWAATNQTHYVQFGDGTAGGAPYAGYVAYAHATDTLSLGTATATRAIISSTGVACFANTVCAPMVLASGCVGIGTTSPNYILDLQTTSTFITNNLKVNASAAANNYAEIAFQLWSGAGSGQNVFGGSETSRPSAVIRALSEDDAARGALLFATFNGGATNATLTEKMRITSCGNVWIGNDSNPMLEIANGGSADVLSGIKWRVGGARDDYGGIYTAAASAYNNYVAFYTRCSATTVGERMRITSGGNVGIGTTSPGTSKLYVSGDATNYGITSEAPSGYGKLILKQTSGQAWSVGLSSNDLFFYYGGTSAGTRVTFANGGNVGIGTTSPVGKLNVFGAKPNSTSTDTALLTIDDSTSFASGVGGSLLLRGNYRGLGDQVAGAGIEASKVNSTDGDYGFNMLFYTRQNGSSLAEKMRITSGGNVLIGTTTGDGYKLQIVGASQATATFGQTYAGVAAYSQWVNSSGAFVMGLDGAAGTTERMRITAAGLVGIGTTAPAVKLDIQSSSSGTSLGDGMLLKLKNTSTTTNTRSGITFGNIDGIGGSLAMQSAILKNSATGEYDMTFDLYGGSAGWQEGLLYLDSNPGRVGIGTTSPIYTLDVRGGGMFNGDLRLDNNELNTPKTLFFSANSTTGDSYGNIKWYNVQWDGYTRGEIVVEGDGALANGRMVFKTGASGGNATEKMRITSAGIACFACTVCTPRIVAGEAILGNSYTCTFPVACVGGTYATVIPPNTLNSLTVYLAHIYYDNGTASPYTANTAFIFKTTNTNGGGTDNAYFPMTSTHQGGTGCWSFRTIAGTGQVSSGLQIQAHSFANNISNATLYLVRLA